MTSLREVSDMEHNERATKSTLDAFSVRQRYCRRRSYITQVFLKEECTPKIIISDLADFFVEFDGESPRQKLRQRNGQTTSENGKIFTIGFYKKNLPDQGL